MPYLRHTEVDEIAAASREVARRVVLVMTEDLEGLTSILIQDHFLCIPDLKQFHEVTRELPGNALVDLEGVQSNCFLSARNL